MGVPTVVSLALVACVLICDYTSVVTANSLADIAAKIKRRTFENFDMAREKRKMCSDSNESCGMPWVCCDDLICQRDSYFKSGRCVTCVGQTGPCVSDDECCGHESRSAQCDKSRLGKVFGKCLPPRENGETCFETALGGIDTQCKSGYCDMDWSKSSGVCKNINVA